MGKRGGQVLREFAYRTLSVPLLTGTAQRSLNPPRVPHHSGALLPPTIYNPPLPRYKPVQPPGITMMIFRRRIARARRMQKSVDLNETLKAITMEADVFRQCGAGGAAPVLHRELYQWGECSAHLRSDAV